MLTLEHIQPIDLTKQSCCSSLKDRPAALPTQETIACADECTSKRAKFSLNESDSIRQVRLRGLSHWPHANPSREQMSASGWFSCNVSDRVICIYCNTICQTWTRHDNPAEVHARLAPLCPLVLAMPSVQRTPATISSTLKEKLKPHHPNMAEVSRREQTFSNGTWTQTSPKVEDLVRAGFFYSGTQSVVTCFYCNGSLHKWSGSDNPMVEHVRWFPACLYIKHLCGDDLYDNIQIHTKPVITEKKIGDSELAQIVSARLDLPVVERLRSQYLLPVIKRCIEDQWRIRNDDFESDKDLAMACLILKKQIDIIKGSKDKIIVPSKSLRAEQNTKIVKQSPGECLICLTDERQLACMPCGHLCACVPCGYSLRSCPVCRQKIECFMRINS